MIDREQALSPHFKLDELVPKDLEFVPPWVLGELGDLCVDLLEPIRNQFGVLIIHDAYRPLEKNAAVGGVKDSDHLDGKAADFHIAGDLDHPWHVRTIAAFHWARQHLAGRYGQIILEDHREVLHDSAKLWVHIATPSGRHPGTSHDWNAVLISHEPHKYVPFMEPSAGTATASA